ncbi:FAD-dependent oxidoreductase [Sinorhizobium sp. 7-81]|uniref:NAD(P)/FAD-dependent oxidoreductase n=1 Tax=Sinorhizobium sp. 8-89 TaxID=3049089 RepID=UPI0024C324C1|nr:FAD-dependent oxidoreductase [Sinorhizobium sp. 8-89]MDK1493698.1 FAD-dependent oxidoreductase [Sinorhizobium sp. 8-89]
MAIVGAGECGTRAAYALREAGYNGPVTLIGDEASLPYERPPLSKPSNRGIEHKLICDTAQLEAAGITYLPGTRVTSLDSARKVISLDKQGHLPYERLLLATGATPRRLTCPGGELTHVLRTLEDAKRLYEMASTGARFAIIGAGLIGMELAACLKKLGIDVTVIDVATRPLGRAVPDVLARRIHERHVEEGVKFRFDAIVEEIDKFGVRLTDKSLVAADVVITAIGVAPNISLAKASGVSTQDGVLVDAFLRTSASDIFAAGDCARLDLGAGKTARYETWRNARVQGEIAARNMAGGAQPITTQPWFWSDQYELGLQVVGLPSRDHVNITRHLVDGAEIVFFLDEHGRLAAAAGLGPGGAIAKDIRLAEMLIDTQVSLDTKLLADPTVSLKSFLKRTQLA